MHPSVQLNDWIDYPNPNRLPPSAQPHPIGPIQHSLAGLSQAHPIQTQRRDHCKDSSRTLSSACLLRQRSHTDLNYMDTGSTMAWGQTMIIQHRMLYENQGTHHLNPRAQIMMSV